MHRSPHHFTRALHAPSSVALSSALLLQLDSSGCRANIFQLHVGPGPHHVVWRKMRFILFIQPIVCSHWPTCTLTDPEVKDTKHLVPYQSSIRGHIWAKFGRKWMKKERVDCSIQELCTVNKTRQWLLPPGAASLTGATLCFLRDYNCLMRNHRMWTLALSDTSFRSQSWAFDLGAAYLQDRGSQHLCKPCLFRSHLMWAVIFEAELFSTYLHSVCVWSKFLLIL